MPSVTRRSTGARARREDIAGTVFAAVERLLEAGASFTDLGVQRIADEAGIGRSTFYLHFADKNELLLRLTRTATADLFAAARAWVDGEGADPAQLQATMLEVIAHRRAHAGVLRALDEVATYDEEVAGFWGELVDAFAADLRLRIEADQARDAVPAELHAATVARVLVWSVERAVARHVVEPRDASDEQLAATLVRVVRSTLYAA